MPDYQQLSKEELIRKLELKEELLQRDENKAARLAHDLQVHQIELETQNSELRDKQRELEAARDRYANLYDFAPIGYLTLDAKGVIRNCNLTATRLLNQSRAELLDKPFNTFLKKRDKGSLTDKTNDFFSALHTAIETRQDQSVELQLQHNETCIDIQLLMTVKDDQFTVEILATLQNISERKNQQRKLKHKMHELDQMNLAMIDREMRMIELKTENQSLKIKLAARTPKD